MLAWSEGIDNGRQKTRNHGYDVIVGGELVYWLLRSPSQTCHAKPKLKSTGAGCYQLLPVGGMPTASSLAWKTSLRKSQDAVALQQIKERGAYLWLIVVISTKSTVAAISAGFTAGRWLWSRSSIRLTAWLQNSKKRAERLIEIDVWAESPRLPLLWLSASSFACHGLLTAGITPLPIKPSATKMPENWKLANAAITGYADASAWCCCARCKIHEGVRPMLKLKMMLCAWCRWSSSVAHQSSLSVSAWSHHASGVDNAASPRLADTAERDYFTSERGWSSLCKNNLEGNLQKHITEQCR